MERNEFEALKNYHLSMPDCMISSFDKSDKRKMSMFYDKVRQINRNRKIETPDETHRRLYE